MQGCLSVREILLRVVEQGGPLCGGTLMFEGAASNKLDRTGDLKLVWDARDADERMLSSICYAS